MDIIKAGRGRPEWPDCWEVENCPEGTRNGCPAYPDRGKECWKLTGTKCGGGAHEKSSLAEKIVYCRNHCDYYKKYIKSLYP